MPLILSQHIALDSHMTKPGRGRIGYVGEPSDGVVQRIAEDDFIWMDRFTIKNLELYHSTNTNAVTLLDVIDKTISPMGGRMIKRWLALPL